MLEEWDAVGLGGNKYAKKIARIRRGEGVGGYSFIFEHV